MAYYWVPRRRSCYWFSWCWNIRPYESHLFRRKV